MSLGIEIWNLTRLDRVNWEERFMAIELVLLGGLSVGVRLDRGVRLNEQPNRQMASAGGRGIAPALVSNSSLDPWNRNLRRFR